MNRLPFFLLLAAMFLGAVVGGQVVTDKGMVFGGMLDDWWAGGPASPLLLHGVLGLLVTAGVALAYRRGVVTLPPFPASVAAIVFVTILLATTAFSNFRIASLGAAAEWGTYFALFYGLVATVGRRTGPVLVCGAIAAGAVVIALRCLLEYAGMKAVDPTWRVFGGWVNPNAAAAILAVGFFAGLAVVDRVRPIYALLVWLGGATIVAAILLTASKGVALVFAIVALGSLVGGFRTDRRLVPAVLVPILLGGLLFVGATRPAPQAAATGGGAGLVGRVQGAGSTAEQSGGFRRNLWVSTAKLVAERPVGWGPGTFRYEAARPGIVTQTNLAHQSWLQLAAETSPLGLGAFLAFVGIVVWRARKGVRSPVRVACAAGMAIVLGHSFIDSDLHYFGLGLAFMALLAAWAMTGYDGVAPENVPASTRGGMIAGAVVLPLILLALGSQELARARIRSVPMGPETTALLDALPTWDPANAALRARFHPEPSERLRSAVIAAAGEPSTGNLRLLADARLAIGDLPGAERALREALRVDPNNLPTLIRLVRIAERGADPDALRKAVNATIAVEETTYYRTRSLPELIPTETFEARLALARGSVGLADRLRLLKEAVEGYRKYASTTAPLVLRMAENGGYAGESKATMQAKMRTARDAARELTAAQRRIGESPAEAEAAAALFESLLK